MKTYDFIREIRIPCTKEEAVRLANIAESLADEGIHFERWAFEAIITCWGLSERQKEITDRLWKKDS